MTIQSCLTRVATAASLLVLSSIGLHAAPTGVIETSIGAFTFEPTSCTLYKDGDFYDIEIGGTGTSPDGEKFYFELSSTANEMTIGLGVDRPFASADRQLKAGRYVSQEFTLVVAERLLSASGVVLVNENGELVDANAILTIDCSA